MRFIQGLAVDRILELSERVETATSAYRDPFGLERRYELQFPGMALFIPKFLQGYEKNRASALAALSYLDNHFEINAAMKQALLKLCKDDLKVAEDK
jgi:hypothetical protein